MSTLKLKELIHLVRSCKTQQEERGLIAKECALIRTSFSDPKFEFRHRNIAKLLYIQMLGYPTNFGQMECITMISRPLYSDKRIGYLGLMLLLDENQDVITLETSLLSESHKIVRRLSKSCCSPEIHTLGKNDLIVDCDHGTLVSGIALIIELIKVNPDCVKRFTSLTQTLIRILKSLIMSSYSQEYDERGINDPFLQCKILQLLMRIGNVDVDASAAMNDILAQISTNTESSCVSGNAILYECVNTILGVKSEDGLKIMAINILGRFLTNGDNNLRYVALNTLRKVLNVNREAVKKHTEIIVSCLKDKDITIRTRASSLLFDLIDSENVKYLTRELVNFLAIADSKEKGDLVRNLCSTTEKYSPDAAWYFDTVMRIIAIGGAFIPHEVPSKVIKSIELAPSLQQYAVEKLYTELNLDNSQLPLAMIGVWCLGEYSSVLSASTTSLREVLGVVMTIADVHKNSTELVTAALNAALKISDRSLTSASQQDTEVVQKAKEFFENCSTNMDPEIQTRACEYLQIITNQTSLKIIAAAIPSPNDKNSLISSLPNVSSTSAQPASQPQSQNLVSDLLGISPQQQQQQTALSSDLLNVQTVQNQISTPQMTTPSSSLVNIAKDISQKNENGDLVAFDENGLKITFAVSHPPNSPHLYSIQASFSSVNELRITGILLKVAVPKWLKLQLNGATGSSLEPHTANGFTQLLRVVHQQYGDQNCPTILRLRVAFDIDSAHFEKTTEVTIPKGL